MTPYEFFNIPQLTRHIPASVRNPQPLIGILLQGQGLFALAEALEQLGNVGAPQFVGGWPTRAPDFAGSTLAVEQ